MALTPFTPISALPPLPTPAQLEAPVPVRVVYNNDPHEKIQAMPRVVSAFDYFSRQGQAQNQDVLRLNGGDNNIGSETKEWELTVLLNNLIQFNAMANGNHEFDLGSTNFARGLTLANAPTVVSNLRIPQQGAFADQVRAGKLITGAMIIPGQFMNYGVIGLTTPELKNLLSSKTELDGISAETYERTVHLVREQVAQLKAQGVNTVFVVSHMGYELDKRLAERVIGLDVIVGGHSHTNLHGVVPEKNLVTSPTGEPVLILQAGKNANAIGVADLLFNTQGQLVNAQNLLYDPYQFSKHPTAEMLKAQFLGPATNLFTIGNKYDNDNNAFEPDPVAELTADALRAAANTDVALVRSSSLRRSVWPGPFTDQDLNELIPFKDQQVALTLTGDELDDILENAAESVTRGDNHPGFLNASGVSFTVNQKTQDVQDVLVWNRQTNQWEEIDEKKQYTVAVDEYSVHNPSDFPDLGHPDRIFWQSGRPLKDFFMMGMQARANAQGGVHFQTDGRSRVIEG